jgi:hypothetical protein
VERTFPAGLEVEVVTVEALRMAAAEVRDPLAMISPTAAIRERPDRFRQAHLKAHRDWSHYDWRVKTPADLAFARSIYDALYPADPGFSMHDVLDLVESHQDLGRFAARREAGRAVPPLLPSPVRIHRRLAQRLGHGRVGQFARQDVEPLARWMLLFSASRPWSARARPNGRVALPRASDEVRGAAPGMLATQ